MLSPNMGIYLYKINLFLFGEFAYYYPFGLFVLNYLYYKRAYRLENFQRRELFGLAFFILACLMLFGIFYQDFGYILELVYDLFSSFLGYTGSGILALFFLLFSIILLFPNFIKELFKIELDFSFLLKIEEKIKNIILNIFGGENEKEELGKSEPKAPILEVKNEIFKEIKEEAKEEKNLEDEKQESLEIKQDENLTKNQAKTDFMELKNQNLDEELVLDEKDAKEAKSFIYENSQELKSFVKKASRSTISLDEDLNFIPEEEVEMIPERFLKPKKLEDLKELDEKNLDTPSYKRKNIQISSPANDFKPKIFNKELQMREDFMQKAKLEEEYKSYQNKLLQNNTQKELDELQKEDEKNSIIQSTKYTLTNAQTQPEILEFNENDFKLKSVEELRDNTLDFEPVVEELSSSHLQPHIIKIEEIKDKEESNTQKTHSIVAKEIELNKNLLKEIEQGEFQKPKDFKLPPLEFLTSPSENKQDINESEIDKKIYNLLEKLRRFKIGGDVISTYIGPVVTTFEFRPSADVKVSRILNLQDDLTMALMAKSIRIQAPIPGKDVVGIEVPNDEIQTIYLSEILQSEVFKNSKSPLTIALGKDIVGNAFVTDLKKLPHLLIAGTTGSGKSVGINSMLLSLLYRNSPKTLRLMMIDPKMLEFSIYNDIPHLLTPVITDPKKAVNALSNMVAEMERRYRLMADVKTKNIENYNEKMKELGTEELPFIVVIIDELADLMMTAGKDVEFYIGRLAQMARASGIHLIVATQRPSVDVVTGLIKANLPSRISYKVGQKIDSKVILDAMGAESLLGRGDCLFTPPGTSSIVRLHAPFASEFEIEKVVEFLKNQQSAQYDESFLKDQQSAGVVESQNYENGDFDELYEDAKRVILEDGKTSISYLQRRLKIGYNRAANIIEQLAQNGVLSEPDSKGQREILN